MAGSAGDNHSPWSARAYELRRKALIDKRGGPGDGDLGDFTSPEYVMLLQAHHETQIAALRPLDDMASSRAAADQIFKPLKTVEEVKARLAIMIENHSALAHRARLKGQTFPAWSLEFEAGERAIDQLEGRFTGPQPYEPPSLSPPSPLICEFCPAALVSGDGRSLNIFCDALHKWTFRSSVVDGALVTDPDNLAMDFCTEHQNQIRAFQAEGVEAA